MNNLVFTLLDIGEIGGSHIKTVSNPGQAVNGINEIMTNIGIAVGVVIILWGLVKLLMSFATENPADKQQSSLMFGVGVVFISISQILKTLALEEILKNHSANATYFVAQKIIGIICVFLSYAGAILAVMAIINLIMAFVQEQPESRASGAKQAGVAIGLLSISGLGNAIKSKLGARNHNITDYMSDIIGFIANTVTYIGVFFAIMGIWYVANSFRNEDGVDRQKGINFLIAAIALISIRAIIATVFGIQIRQQPFYT